MGKQHEQQRQHDEHVVVKIADFGFAKRVTGPKSLTTMCGTPSYVAAEILNGEPYDTQADMWSVGCVAYILLGGRPPFQDDNPRTLYRKIRKGKYKLDSKRCWSRVSEGAKNFVRNLLEVNPDERYDSHAALADEWIIAGDADGATDALAAIDLRSTLVELKKFDADRRKFHTKTSSSCNTAVDTLRSLGVDLERNLDY